jgi:hypothetical protein
MTPFQQGQTAAKTGKPRTGNPFPKPLAPDDGPSWPGDWHNWDAGWHNASETMAHDAKLRSKA